MQQEVDHFMYPRAKMQQADAVAWIFTDVKSDLVKYPFKFQELQPEEVRLKVLHTSLCYSDVMHARQMWFSPGQYPCCVGHEIIGQVTIIGPEVTQLKVGDYVGVSPVRHADLTCHYCTCKLKTTQMCQNRVYTYDAGYFGGYATHMQVDQNWTFKLPQPLYKRLHEIPPLLCAGVTVYRPLQLYAKPGGKCAVIGIGGLGHLGLQFANRLGMKVTAFTTKVDKVEPLHQLGASDVQHSTNEEQLAQNEGQYDLVLSTLYIQKPVLHRLHQRLTKPGGTFVMVGAPATQTPYILDNEYLVNNQITIAGSNVGSIADVTDMLKFAAHYGIFSINEYYEFEDFNKAFHRLEKENPRFRCVVNVTDWAKKNGFDK